MGSCHVQCPGESASWGVGGAGLWPSSPLGRCRLGSQGSGANPKGVVEAAQSRPLGGSSRRAGRGRRAGGACAAWTWVPLERGGPRAPGAVRVRAARGPQGQPGPGQLPLQASPLTSSRDPAP